jgi:hypothetical protein
LGSLMSSRRGGIEERTHNNTSEHAEKREWKHGRKNDRQ